MFNICIRRVIIIPAIARPITPPCERRTRTVAPTVRSVATTPLMLRRSNLCRPRRTALTIPQGIERLTPIPERRKSQVAVLSSAAGTLKMFVKNGASNTLAKMRRSPRPVFNSKPVAIILLACSISPLARYSATYLVLCDTQIQ
jgi:hypothetical protein